MKWNIFLLIFSLFILSGSIFFEKYGYLTPPEAIAEDLSPLINIDKYVLWDNIEDILESHWSEYAAFDWIPWAIVSVILIAKLTFDIFKNKKASRVKERLG